MPSSAGARTWRDLNGNGVMDPYEDPHRSAEERVDDLVGRLSLEEKAGLMFQTVIEPGAGGTLLEEPGRISKSPTSAVVLGKHLNHFNVHALGTAREAARWSNALQRLAEQTPHGIPVTVSTDPRHAFMENSGTSFSAGSFSQWPEPLGLAALDDEQAIRGFADIARREYRAVGIHAALHPQIDLATEPRWGRQVHTFGDDPDRTSRAVVAYLHGFQGPTLGRDSVACVTKHFPGAGPQKDGEDAHFPYGREQVYPGGRFETHLRPFRAAIAHGTAGIMPYYGMPVGLVLDGEPIEPVGFGYNRQIVTGLLRRQLGYDGVVVTDWELVNDNHVGGQVLPARAWGVEHLGPADRMVKILEAGADQFGGGEECVELLVELVRGGRVPESRIDESARRLLLVKFRLGLFDDPYVDEDAADAVVGHPDFRAAGHRAQAESVTVLENRDGMLPLPTQVPGRRVYVEGIDREVAAVLGDVVDDPAQADVAIVRLTAPYEVRDDLFLETYFHQGSLEFRPGLVARLAHVAATTPLVVDVTLDRPAILTPLVGLCAALTASYGTSGAALVDALTATIAPRGRLPFEVPRSMQAVRDSREDVPRDTVDPVYPAWTGLDIRPASRDVNLRLVWPQWQGGGTSSVRELAPELPFDVARRGYAVGAAVLDAVLPPHDGPTVTAPVTMGDEGLELLDGVEAKSIVLQQLGRTLEIIAQHHPARIATLGGECSVSVAPFCALADRYGDDLAVVWIDSNPDVGTGDSEYPGYHAMAVSALTGHGDPDVLNALPATIRADRVALVGLHAWTDDDYPHVAEWGLTAFGPEDLRSSSKPLLDWLAATGCSRVAIHFDVDTIDSDEIVLGLGAEPDGLTSEQVRRIVADVDHTVEVVGLQSGTGWVRSSSEEAVTGHPPCSTAVVEGRARRACAGAAGRGACTPRGSQPTRARTRFSPSILQ